MIARSNGQVVLVAGALPDERAAIRIDRIGKGVAYGHVTMVEEPSADRREPFVDPACGGCLYAHVAYQRQLALKSQVIADALTRIGRLVWTDPIRVAASPDEGYRMRSRLHIRNGRIGFFREGTHELCDVRATKQLLPETSDAIDRLAEYLRSAPGIAGELEVSENITASERVAHFESPAPLRPGDWLTATAGLPLTGVTLTAARHQAGPATVVRGDPHVTDVLTLDGHDVRLRRHVQAFFQGNRFLLSDLVRHVVGAVTPGSEVLDLYAGAGLFSVSAAVTRGAHVTAVEGDRFAAADLAANASVTGGAVRAVHQSVETFAAAAHQRRAPAVLIVDPPRTGMSKAALAGALQWKAPQIVYVSCDVATLARDARRLVDAGYGMQSATGFDLFPNTPHVETVAVFAL